MDFFSLYLNRKSCYESSPIQFPIEADTAKRDAILEVQLLE